MSTAVALVFWAAVAVPVYAWVGYPLVLALLARRRGHAVGRPDRRAMPMVTIIVAAFNEARVIRDKLESSLAQRYPVDRLEVIVVSDGSTDGTDAIVENYGDPRVRLLRQWPRAGKSLALNRAVAVARGEILVFTDADARFDPDAIARLVAGFDDVGEDGTAPVGVVSGVGLYAAREGSDAPGVSNGYARLESFLKVRESALGFIASADGAIYALRRTLYRELGAAEVNDLLHPIQAALAGFVSRFDPGAVTTEPPSQGAGQEFKRHTRIIAQGYHIVAAWVPRLISARRWRASWILLSHRPARWTTWFWLGLALASNVALARRGGLYTATLAAQGAFYSLAAAGAAAERAGIGIGRLALPYYFCVVSAAGLAGLLRFLRGGTQAVWDPRGAGATDGTSQAASPHAERYTEAAIRRGST